MKLCFICDFIIIYRVIFSDFKLIFIAFRIVGILAFVLIGLNELLILRCLKFIIKIFKESERWGIRITGVFMEILMDTRGDFFVNWVMAIFVFLVMVSDVSRIFFLVVLIWFFNFFIWKLFRYFCLEIYDLERNFVED